MYLQQPLKNADSAYKAKVMKKSIIQNPIELTHERLKWQKEIPRD